MQTETGFKIESETDRDGLAIQTGPG